MIRVYELKQLCNQHLSSGEQCRPVGWSSSRCSQSAESSLWAGNGFFMATNPKPARAQLFTGLLAARSITPLDVTGDSRRHLKNSIQQELQMSCVKEITGLTGTVCLKRKPGVINTPNAKNAYFGGS